MNTVSNTAYYCCGVRMLDAERDKPLVNDTYARRFMDDNALAIFEPFRSEIRPNISNICRCDIIDNLLRREIAANPATYIITIGAGFDTRPYRIKGGNWTEVDEAQIIDHKDKVLPIGECANPLKRIPTDFSRESLVDILPAIDKRQNIVIVIEGVLMYLEPQAIKATIQHLQSLFPQHVLYCDLMSRHFFENFVQSVHAKLETAGGRFTERPERPWEIFIDNGYRLDEQQPMLEHAAETGLIRRELKLPGPLFRLFMKLGGKDIRGYTVYRFTYMGE